MNLDKAIQGRKSVQHFSNKKPSWKKIIECIDAARYSPMAGNIFPLKFILVHDKKTIAEIAEASQQSFVGEAQYIVVVCSDDKMTLNAYEERANKFCRQQAGAAIENFLLKLQEKKLNTCWIGYFTDYLIKKALNIPEDIEIEALFPIGYESKAIGNIKEPKRKIELDNILYFDKWKNKRMKKEKKLNA